MVHIFLFSISFSFCFLVSCFIEYSFSWLRLWLRILRNIPVPPGGGCGYTSHPRRHYALSHDAQDPLSSQCIMFRHCILPYRYNSVSCYLPDFLSFPEITILHITVYTQPFCPFASRKPLQFLIPDPPIQYDYFYLLFLLIITMLIAAAAAIIRTR